MTLFQARRGVTLIETMATVAIVAVMFSGTAWVLRQLRWTAQRQREQLTADTLAWDILWKAYNARVGANSPITNATLRLDHNENWRRSAGRVNLALRRTDEITTAYANQHPAHHPQEIVGDIAYVPAPRTPVLAGDGTLDLRKGWFYTVDVSWFDRDMGPAQVAGAPSDQRLHRRLTIFKNRDERAWRKVYEESLVGPGGAQ